MTGPITPEQARVRLASNVDTQSIEGHDRDCARAIWSQANLGERLSTIQVEHLLSIGARSGRATSLLSDRIVQLAEEWEADPSADLTQRACAALLRAALYEFTDVVTPPGERTEGGEGRG